MERKKKMGGWMTLFEVLAMLRRCTARRRQGTSKERCTTTAAVGRRVTIDAPCTVWRANEHVADKRATAAASRVRQQASYASHRRELRHRRLFRPLATPRRRAPRHTMSVDYVVQLANTGRVYDHDEAAKSNKAVIGQQTNRLLIDALAANDERKVDIERHRHRVMAEGQPERNVEPRCPITRSRLITAPSTRKTSVSSTPVSVRTRMRATIGDVCTSAGFVWRKRCSKSTPRSTP